jgi:hypothetical protein
MEPGIVQLPHADLKLEKVERQRAAGPAIRAKRAAKRRIDPKQTVLDYADEREGDKDDSAKEPA